MRDSTRMNGDFSVGGVLYNCIYPISRYVYTIVYIRMYPANVHMYIYIYKYKYTSLICSYTFVHVLSADSKMQR